MAVATQLAGGGGRSLVKLKLTVKKKPVILEWLSRVSNLVSMMAC